MVKKGEIQKTADPAVDSGSGFNPVQLLQESKAELAKVVWPTRQQLIGESLAVIAMVSLSATVIYLVNNLFGWLANDVIFKVPL
jgi:preprotein translocase subunit SecE